MFDNIDKKQYKILILWKYFFQLVLAPALTVLTFIAVVLGLDAINWLDLNMVLEKTAFVFSVEIHWWKVYLLIICLVALLPNLLSFVPFLALIADCFAKNDCETKEIQLTKISPLYELHGANQYNRFSCDAFSSKISFEALLYDENHHKYRFLWKETYSDTIKNAELSIRQAIRMKISYYKRSRIIYACEVLEKREY